MCNTITWAVSGVMNAPVDWKSEAKVIGAITLLVLVLIGAGIKAENYAILNTPKYKAHFYEKVYFTTAGLIAATTALVYAIRHFKHSGSISASSASRRQ